jgi:hypothetical protein
LRACCLALLILVMVLAAVLRPCVRQRWRSCSWSARRAETALTIQ